MTFIFVESTVHRILKRGGQNTEKEKCANEMIKSDMIKKIQIVVTKLFIWFIRLCQSIWFRILAKIGPRIFPSEPNEKCLLLIRKFFVISNNLNNFSGICLVHAAFVHWKWRIFATMGTMKISYCYVLLYIGNGAYLFLWAR